MTAARTTAIGLVPAIAVAALTTLVARAQTAPTTPTGGPTEAVEREHPVDADDAGAGAAAGPSPPPSDAVLAEIAATAAPPHDETTFFQYGFALTGEFVVAPGAMCANRSERCVLGSGGGIAVRVGFRPTGHWYFGGAYEVSKQDPESLLRLATLQQLRGEGRYYLHTGRDTEPYLAAGVGLAAYGNELSFDTKGPGVFLALGAETQISRTHLVGGALAYRMMYFTPFDLSGLGRREASFAHIFGLDMTLEVLDAR